MVPDKKKELHGIYGIWHKPFWQAKAFYLSILSTVIVLFGLLIFFIFKKLRSKKRSVCAWDQALLELHSLQRLDCTTREKGKYIYATMTSTLKKYLHTRYGYDILSKTDDEVVNYLEHQAVSPDLKNKLSDVLSGSILVKFAREQAIKTQVDRHLATSIDLIKKTIPRDEKAR